MTVRFTPRTTLLILLAATALVYLSLLGAPALNWDDDSNIFANPFYRAGVWAEFWRADYFGLFVPVTSTVWQVLFGLGRGEAWPFRVLNALLHVANVALTYRVLRQLAGPSPSGRSAWAAVAGAALFALHPVQTQAVAWISGGRDLLSAFFALLATSLFLRGGWRSRALATLAFALALLSKPGAVTLPLIVLALAPLARPGEPWRARAPWIAAWLALGAGIAWWTLGAQSAHLIDVPIWKRPWLMGDAFAFYALRLTNLFAYAANYARTPGVVFGRPATLIGAAAAWAALISVTRSARARAYAPYAWAWVAALLPVSGLVSFGYQNISGVADHYQYFALVVVAAAVARAASALDPRYVRRAGACAVAVSAWLTVDVVRRLPVWRSNAAFFGDMVRTAPTAYATALGMSNVACGERGDFASGVKWTEVALADRPLDVRALANQAYCLLHDKKPARVAELDFYLDRMDLDLTARTQPTGYSSLLASIGTAKIQLGEYADGYGYLCEAERVFPAEPTHRRNLTAAAGILRQHDVEPTCDDPDDGPDDPGT